MKIYIRSLSELSQRLSYASQVVSQLMAGGTVVVTIDNEKRHEEQSRKFHAMCRDIAGQCEWAGKKRTADQWKLLLVSGHAVATKQPADCVPGLEGEFLNLRESTAKMGVRRMASLIEYAYAFGVENGVKWRAYEQE